MAFLTDEGDSFSSSTHQWEYDVFLSFRGEDTRYGFTGYLCEALRNIGCKTFIDNDLPKGEGISAELIKTIKSSRISIIIFSQNYAFSTWCLEELIEILKCKENGQTILPIFYKVDPSEVRKQKGNFGIALAKQEEKFKNNTEKVLRWRAALKETASLSGFHYEDGCGFPEYQFMQGIIREVSNTRKLNRRKLYVTTYPIGVDSRAANVESLLNINLNDVRVVGILGLGGIGKTTIAKAIYNRVVDHFEGSSFVMNVRENSSKEPGIIELQEKLLCEVLGHKKFKVHNSAEGINVIKKEISNKKVLLILDDVDKFGQIENFLGKCDWLAKGSRVIITTRDKHVLTTLAKIPLIYEVKVLHKHEALQLFSKYAFNKNEPEADYLQLTYQFICYANGLPLALQIIGSDLRGRSISQWESELEKYKNIPNKEIQNILKVSFEGLDKNEQDIFLDIACFFKGLSKDYVVDILAACNLYPNSGIPKLIDKCLIRIEGFDKLWMHDLIQQMGREIVQQESDVLGKRTRLWCYDDALEVLKENTDSDKIRGIMLCSHKPITMTLAAKAFKRMRNLKFLLFDNVHICEELKYLPNGLRLIHLPNYLFPLPSNFCPEKLVTLEMPCSHIRIEKFFKQDFQFQNLKRIDLSGCESITKLPNLCAPNLENLNLSYCQNLVECHESIGLLDKLQELYLFRCEKLQNLPSHLTWFSLRVGDDILPVLFPGYSDVYYCNIEIDGLYRYCCENVEDLRDIPPFEVFYIYTGKLRPWYDVCSYSVRTHAFLDLSNVENLDLSNVGNLIELDFLMKPDYFPVLRILYLIKINIVTIPESITKFTRLVLLGIKCCKDLRDIPRLPQSIRRVHILNSHSLHPQSSNRLFSQFGEFWYPKYEVPVWDGYELTLPGSEIPKWFNHQSVGNSISFWVRRCFPQFLCCVVFEPNEQLLGLTLGVTLKVNGIKSSFPHDISEIRRVQHMTSNHVWFFTVNAHEFQNLCDRNRVELEFHCRSLCEDVYHILRCGIHTKCICPRAQDQDQDLSTDTLPVPPTSIPAFPICSIISNTVCLVDPPSIPVPDDASHISLPSSMDLPNNMTDMFELRLGLPGLGLGSTYSQGFHLGSSSMAHNFVSDLMNLTSIHRRK